MIIKMNDVVNVWSGLAELSTKDFKSKLSFRLALNIRELENKMKSFEETRNSLVKKFGVQDKDVQDRYIIKDESREEFARELESVLEQTVDVNLKTLDINDFGDADVKPETFSKIYTILSDEGSVIV